MTLEGPFYFVMLTGGFIAIFGMVIAFLRGPEQVGIKKQRFID
jgi:hypothetical protein